MDEPLFNELLESVKQADQIMSDHAELRRRAKAATPGPWSCNRHWAIVGGPTLEFTNGAAQQQIAMACWQSWMHEEELRNNAAFMAAANPKTVLALLDEIDGLRSRLEIDERTPHDGIACRDETIKVLDEKCDRLKAENCAHKDTQKHCELLEQYLKECASALPGTYYMDPPDGGDVSIPEQIRRMAKDAARYRWLRERDLETIRQGGVFAGMTPENIVLNQEDLDAEIDAALEGATQ
ncbi:hypothetical protein I5102_003442 [Pseudomonas aeruginosa]|uniref:ead/Ea22-like family protein n=1 Tax=Pseudomonas aeruginosa TaxID=287 RepID=UPI0018E0AC2D|nr:ead/Ea22-like family protein [Pseudomonas aeruginosa]QPP24949.1 hypothetical protein I5102_003442 [Pseudomonas aeruginosa]